MILRELKWGKERQAYDQVCGVSWHDAADSGTPDFEERRRDGCKGTVPEGQSTSGE